MPFSEVRTLPRPQEKPNHLDHPVLKRLENLRKRMGLSKEQFAVKHIGVSYITYYRWCKGGAFRKTTIERLEELEELADKLERELEGR